MLVGSGNKKRLDWPIGRVTDLPGKDGDVHLVRIITLRGQFLRSIQRLYSLEESRIPPGNDIKEDPTAEPTKVSDQCQKVCESSLPGPETHCDNVTVKIGSNKSSLLLIPNIVIDVW